MRSESLLLSLKGMDRCLPELPDHVRTERWNMALYLTRYVCVERNAPSPRCSPPRTPTGRNSSPA
ncbi:hypothetical protein [Actinopolyspora xinjiangensis]|uniref:hypothetical protein n=1 Tax=Actinopolyspora xinjiangensis TaxID=405564 RepID=UPI0011140B31|nr:hypothetical protein [Actinopolyspora xinjiangensis]